MLVIMLWWLLEEGGIGKLISIIGRHFLAVSEKMVSSKKTEDLALLRHKGCDDGNVIKRRFEVPPYIIKWSETPFITLLLLG